MTLNDGDINQSTISRNSPLGKFLRKFSVIYSLFALILRKEMRPLEKSVTLARTILFLELLL